MKIINLLCFIKQLKQNKMTTKKQYAEIIFNGSNTYMVVDSANQCLFATQSERKAKNFLKRVLFSVGIQA